MTPGPSSRASSSDSAMNYNLTFAIDDFFRLWQAQRPGVRQRVQQLLVRYRRRIQQAQLNLIDSHDVPRFLTARRGMSVGSGRGAVPVHPSRRAYVFYGDERGPPAGMSQNTGSPWTERQRVSAFGPYSVRHQTAAQNTARRSKTAGVSCFLKRARWHPRQSWAVTVTIAMNVSETP